MSAVSIFWEVFTDLWVSFFIFPNFTFTLISTDLIIMFFLTILFKFAKSFLVELAKNNLLLRHFEFILKITLEYSVYNFWVLFSSSAAPSFLLLAAWVHWCHSFLERWHVCKLNYHQTCKFAVIKSSCTFLWLCLDFDGLQVKLKHMSCTCYLTQLSLNLPNSVWK